MKLRFISSVFVAIILLGFVGCNNDESTTLSVPDTTYVRVSGNGGQDTIKLKCSTSWTAQILGDDTWLTLENAEGTGDGEILVNTVPNVSSSERTAHIIITAQDYMLYYPFTQSSAPDFMYEIPVVFQILNSQDKNITPERLTEIVESVNEIYAKNKVNVEFVMAKTNPSGEAVATAGVQQYNLSSTELPESISEALLQKHSNQSYLWDFNDYINIVVMEDKIETTKLGEAAYPILNTHYSIAPFTTTAATVLGVENVNNTQAIFLNSDFIDQKSLDFGYDYNATDPTFTLAHQLGHYLGLLHLYTLDDSKVDDYCSDTYSYDYSDYMEWRNDLISNQDVSDFASLAVRIDSTGVANSAVNVMDINEAYYTEFTKQQIERMRLVLRYGLTIPGPKAFLDRDSKTKVQDHSLLLNSLTSNCIVR